MMKTRFTKLMALAAIASMVASSVSVSANSLTPENTSQKVEGDAWVQAPTVEVELPGDLTFGINPLRITVNNEEAGISSVSAQIIGSDYTVTNYSDVNVIVSANTKASMGSGVTDVSFNEAPTYDADSREMDPADGKKNIWLAQLYPTSGTTVTPDGADWYTVSLNVTEPTYADGVEGTVMGQTVSTGDANVQFRLAPFNSTDNVLVSGNVSGFRFAGSVDPNANFKDGDVHVETLFSLTTVTKDQADNSYEDFEAPNSQTGFDSTVVQDK